MNGYQSDFQGETIKVNGNIPVDCLAGDFGVATNINGNDYDLVIDPLPASYRDGLLYKVMFDSSNLGAPIMRVGTLAYKPIRRLLGNNLIDLPNVGGIIPNHLYLLVDKGSFFQIVNEPLDQGTQQYIHSSFDTISLGSGTGEQQLGSPLNFDGGYFNNHPILEVKVGGTMQAGEVKTLRLTQFGATLFEHTTSTGGSYSISVLIGRRSSDRLSCKGTFLLDGAFPAFSSIEVTGLNFNQFSLLRFTVEVASAAPGSITRELFIVRGTIS